MTNGKGTVNTRDPKSPPFKTVALLLQGGGALGSYQAGVYEALAGAGVLPTWVAGISIGAINSALIVGNPPERRVARLREFWETVSMPPLGPFGVPYNPSLNIRDEEARRFINQARALGIALFGVPGFFRPRFPSPLLWPSADPGQLSHYDVGPLRATLERLVDFDRINDGDVRLSVGTVNVRSGSTVYFDTATHRIDARHILASGALPTGFPATEIDGEHYWDGGIVSNTPLQWVIGKLGNDDLLAFQVDLWNAAGEVPRDLVQAEVRENEIRFASRTRAGTNQIREAQRLRQAFRRLYDRLPAELREDQDAELLAEAARERVYSIVELIYESKNYEGAAKNFEFSRRTMEEHWHTGINDAARALAHPRVLQRPEDEDGFQVLDFASKRASVAET